MDTCIYMAESLCYSPETITTLLISCTPIQNLKFLKKKICIVEVRKYLNKIAVSHIKKKNKQVFSGLFHQPPSSFCFFPAITQPQCISPLKREAGKDEGQLLVICGSSPELPVSPVPAPCLLPWTSGHYTVTLTSSSAGLVFLSGSVSLALCAVSWQRLPLFCGAEPCCDLGKVTPVLWLLYPAGLEALPSGAWWAVADLP